MTAKGGKKTKKAKPKAAPKPTGITKSQGQVAKQIATEFQERSGDDIELCDICSMETKIDSCYLIIRALEDGETTPVGFYVCNRCIDMKGAEEIESRLSDLQ